MCKIDGQESVVGPPPSPISLIACRYVRAYDLLSRSPDCWGSMLSDCFTELTVNHFQSKAVKDLSDEQMGLLLLYMINSNSALPASAFESASKLLLSVKCGYFLWCHLRYSHLLHL